MLDGGELDQLLGPLMRSVGVLGRRSHGMVQYHVPAPLVGDITKEIWRLASEAEGKARVRLEYLFQGFMSLGG